MSAFGNEFADYARMQYERATERAERHVPDATGCCRHCGRVYPCEGHRDSEYMRDHYAVWLDEPSS